MIQLLGKIPDSITVAVSGGPDSMAALDFLNNGKRRVSVLYFNHMTEHGQVAKKFVRNYCLQRGIGCLDDRIRRKKKDSGDIDLLIKASSKKIYDNFIDTLTQEKYLVAQLARGSKKYMGMGKFKSSPRRIDIMYTRPEEYPFAILYFTGSSEFNQGMRAEALSQGLTMNEYSLKYTDTKKKVDHVFTTEKDIFDYLKYEYIAPEKRIK